METQHHAEPVRPSPFAFLPAPAADAAAVAQERLPFTVKVVHSEQQLRKAVYMRHAAYARHGRDYPGALHCPFSNEGYGLAGVGLLTDCYPIYLLAVERLSESSPEALSGIIKDLRSGIPMAESSS